MCHTLSTFSGSPFSFDASQPTRKASSTVPIGRPDFEGRVKLGTCFPLLALRVTGKDETALARACKELDFRSSCHRCLLTVNLSGATHIWIIKVGIVY